MSKSKRTALRRRRRQLLETLESRHLLASLTGEVWTDANDNGQRDLEDVGAADVRVFLDANDNGRLEPGEQFTQTNASGQYSFNGLPGGDYVVRLDLSDANTQIAPRAYYGTGYINDGTGATHLYEMSESGQVRPIGTDHPERVTGLIRDIEGQLFGVNHLLDSFYRVDIHTGVQTLVQSYSIDITAGLAYDPSSDTIYTFVRDFPGSDGGILSEINKSSGAITNIGPVVGGLDAISSMTFDSVNNTIVAFDNNDDEFLTFSLGGSLLSRVPADQALQSWSMAFNGGEFVMFDQADPERTQLLRVDPMTGATEDAFEASQRLPSESLTFSNRGDVAVRASVTPSEDLFLDPFGVDFDESSVNALTLGGLHINEIMIEPLFGDATLEQYIEIRGDAGTTLEPNTYLVVTDDVNFTAGRIQSVFDLSNQRLGDNGFLVLLQEGNAYSVDPESAVLQSLSNGFEGLPGGIYSEVDSDGRFSNSSTFFLIQSPVAPVPGDDIDLNDDGLADADGLSRDWMEYDSVSLHRWVTGGDQAYGAIALVEEGAGVPDPFVTRPGATVVVQPGWGYAARVGDSIGSDELDWVSGTVQRDTGSVIGAIQDFDDGIFGPPYQYAFQGRDMDHIGDSNFVGGVRGFSFLEPLGADPALPAAGVTVFADTNSNGVRDNLSFVLEPDDFAIDTDLINAVDGVTVNTSTGDPADVADFDILVVPQNANIPSGNRIFSHAGVGFFNESRKLRSDFYSPVNEVSITAIASSSLATPTYIRLQAFDRDDNLLGEILSNPLISSGSQKLTLSFADDVISYAVAFSDQSLVDENGDPIASSPFGRLDRLEFRQFELAATTDVDGFFEITNMFPGDYEITYQGPGGTNEGLFGAEPYPITITEYENFVIGPNSAPVTADLEITVPENIPAGSFLETVPGFDIDGPVSFDIVSQEDFGIQINSTTGVLTTSALSVFDYEATPQIVLEVNVIDELGATSTAVVAINLTNVNEPPIVSPVALSLPEDASAGAVVGQISAFDPDVELNQALSFEIVGGSGQGIFAIDETSGVISLLEPASIDFELEQQLILEIQVSDSGVPSESTTFSQVISITDANDAPRITSTLFTIDENSTGVVATVQVADQDAFQTRTFELTDGDGLSLFEIDDAGNLIVRSGAELNFEAGDRYSLTVLVVDDGTPPLSDTEEITVIVTDVNEAANFVSSTATVAEGATAGTLVATLELEDPEGTPEVSELQLLSTGDAALYSFDPESQQLTVAAGAVIDFEADRLHELSFEVTDTTGGSEPATLSLFVEVLDSNDAPVILTNEFTVSELSTPGLLIGTIRVSDADLDATTVSIIGGTAQELFEVDPNTHELTVATGASFDAESSESVGLTLDVQATDSNGAIDTNTISIVINDVNEPPVLGTELQVPASSSGQPFELVIPEDFIVDPEGGEFSLAVFDEMGVLPDWLGFDPETRTLSGTPNTESVGAILLTLHVYELSSLDLNSSINFQINVELGTTPLTNKRDPLDVDDNKRVAASDALRVINFLSENGLGSPPGVQDFFDGFVDVNGDMRVTALDALLVVNGLVQSSLLEGESFSFAEDDREEAVDAAFQEIGSLF